jgi:hypothetical protein
VIVAIAGSARRRVTQGDLVAVNELVGRLVFEHGRRLCVVSVGCSRQTIGRGVMESCIKLNARFCEAVLVRYGEGFDGDKALLDKLYKRRNLWLADVADEFYLFTGTSEHDMIADVAARAKAKVGEARVHVYPQGSFGEQGRVTA